jgi:hypothetical protein
MHGRGRDGATQRKRKRKGRIWRLELLPKQRGEGDGDG